MLALLPVWFVPGHKHLPIQTTAACKGCSTSGTFFAKRANLTWDTMHHEILMNIATRMGSTRWRSEGLCQQGTCHFNAAVFCCLQDTWPSTMVYKVLAAIWHHACKFDIFKPFNIGTSATMNRFRTFWDLRQVLALRSCTRARPCQVLAVWG